jgi:hypothetical protein
MHLHPNQPTFLHNLGHQYDLSTPYLPKNDHNTTKYSNNVPQYSTHIIVARKK